ncbi:MAG TPA: efflux RND transporter permease subunit [Gammaproteobacteria bacterium]|nr:efflux RND transporter permease subunit [Gammaproteobacteria bacterium]
MSFLRNFLQNHVLANATFVVILLIGTLSYFQLPRAQDPEINFNWVAVFTALPGASTEDVEKLITQPLEDALQGLSDVKFVISNTREGMSDISVRFDDIDERLFDKRLTDLRREVQNKANTDLPDEASEPFVMEFTTANQFPTAMVVLNGMANDEVLRRAARNIRDDIDRLRGVDTTDPAGLQDPEIQIEFNPELLRRYGVTPTQLADTVRAHFHDVSAGELRVGEQSWLVRLIGTSSDPEQIARLPVSTTSGNTPIGELASVQRVREKSTKLAMHEGKPAVLLAVTKKSNANTLELVQRVEDYITTKNPVLAPLGLELKLLDDQTVATRDALRIMQNNAALGLLLVVLVAWIFLGGHIAVFIGIGIPFTLAATFLLLNSIGETLNQSVLLGIVIVLGMLVDDAVVVVEAIYYRLQRGAQALDAAIGSLREVFKPVTSSVLTTMAAFLPLMLMPGLVGDFMFIIPFVVSVALAISLIEAFWMLPVHISAARVNFQKTSRLQALRVRFTHWVRITYCRLLIRVLRYPKRSLGIIILLLVAALGLLASGQVRVQFFAFDPSRLFYINVQMPPGTPLETTMDTLLEIEGKARGHLEDNDTRGIISVAGQMFTEMSPYFGDQYGQIAFSLNPDHNQTRSIDEIVDAMRADVMAVTGPSHINFFIIKPGPPTSSPINVKVRGDSFNELRAATDALWRELETMPAVHDIRDDDSEGKPELRLHLNTDALQRTGLRTSDVMRDIRLLFDGEVVASMQDQGEKVEVRVRAQPLSADDIDEVLRQPIALPEDTAQQTHEIPLGELVHVSSGAGKAYIRHYNFRRTITLQAELDQLQMDTVTANQHIQEHWQTLRAQYPGVDLEFSGELDDIQESLDAMASLFLFGTGLIYLILGSQFRSYWQPFMILATVPLAFIGVVFGLAVTNNPLSLYTLYGVVALAGIAVNAAIVMIDAANTRLAGGMSVLHATVYAARRRVIPIIITSLTTIAGLFSLATGLAGKSLVWGPVASAIVWGLAFSTVLTLFVIPLLYRTFMRQARRPAGNTIDET